MANVPKPPVGAPLDSPQWYEWFRKIWDGVQNPANINWGAINFAGSNLTDIVTRAHNVLQSLQGGVSGEYYHLRQSDYNFVTGLKKLKTTSALNFPNILANTCQELTVSLTGAALGDVVILGAPNNINTGLSWTAYVSATDVVTVRMCNVTTGAIDPPSGTWTVQIL